MVDWLSNGVVATTLVLGAVTAVLALFRRATPPVVNLAVLSVGLLTVVQLVVALVLFVRGPRPEEGGTFVGYLLSSVLIVPAAYLWARVEPGRWSNGVLCVGLLTLCVMQVRMNQLWMVTGG